MIGIIALLAIGGVSISGVLFLRTRVLPDTSLTTNLPPSGARPWSRVRQGSMHGIHNINTIQGDANPHSQQTLANGSIASGAATPWASGMNAPASSQAFSYSRTQTNIQQKGTGYPSSLPFAPAPSVQTGGYGFMDGPAISGFQQPEPLPLPQQNFSPAAPHSSFSPSSQGSDDIALALDAAANFALENNHSSAGGSGVKHRPAPVRLRSMNSSGKVSAVPESGPRSDGGLPTIAETAQKSSGVLPAMPLIPDTPRTPRTPQTVMLSPTKDSEELPALDDPFLRDTLKRYIQNKEKPDTL